MKKTPKTRILKIVSLGYDSDVIIRYTPQVKGFFFWRAISGYGSYLTEHQAGEAIDAYLALLKIGRKEIIEYPTKQV